MRLPWTKNYAEPCDPKIAEVPVTLELAMRDWILILDALSGFDETEAWDELYVRLAPRVIQPYPEVTAAHKSIQALSARLSGLMYRQSHPDIQCDLESAAKLLDQAADEIERLT